MTPLPPHIADLLNTPRPDTATWTKLLRQLPTLPIEQLSHVKRLLQTWPRELPRRPDKSTPAALKPLCTDFDEVDTYPLYIAALASDKRLRLRDGSPAVMMWRQPRGVVELLNGTKMTLGEPGMADLGGTLVLEWGGTPHCACGELEVLAFSEQAKRCADCGYTVAKPNRTELYIEAEIKLDGKIPTQATEYRGSNARKPTATEQDQLTRQRARFARGGFYVFVDRVSDLCDAVVAYRDRVMENIT